MCHLKQEIVTWGAPVGHLAQAFLQLWMRMQVTFEQLQAKSKKKTINKWRRMLNEQAEKVAGEVFKHLRRDDVPDKGVGAMGMAQVLKASPAVLPGSCSYGVGCRLAGWCQPFLS
jgi:hypothetical protein